MAAFAQLGVVGRGINTCPYVIAILRCVKVPNNTFASNFVLKSKKPQRKTYRLLQQAFDKEAMGRTQVLD